MREFPVNLAIFRARAQEVADFRRDHERFPRARANNAEERHLAQWLARVRAAARGKDQRFGNLSPEGSAVLDQLVPGWNEVIPGHRPNDAVFTAKLRKVAAFHAAHGRYPRHDDRLGFWLRRIRHASSGAKGTMAWTAERERLVNEILPGFLVQHD